MKADEASELLENGAAGDDRLKKAAAFLVGILAMALAITGLGAADAAKEIVNSNILASNAYAFFQAKTVRQTVLRAAADDMEIVLLKDSGMPEAAQKRIRERLDEYRRTISRYESELETGEGRKELLARAQMLEQRRDRAQRQDPYFDYAEALLQIAIVLSSISILAGSRGLLAGGASIGGVAVLLALNGFLLIIDLPFLG
jgi:hypothetical protein